MLQFGVPTEMTGIIATLEQRRTGGGTTYSTYFGFDSFMGLPAEDPKTLTPPGGIWREGAYSLTSATRSTAFLSSVSKDMKKSAERVDKALSRHRQPDVASAVRYWESELHAAENRVRLIPGFYNETLTTRLAKEVEPASYVDINCDLYVSTAQALDWLLRHRIARPGTLISYDDCECDRALAKYSME